MRETELEKTSVRRGFTGMHETNARRDDAEFFITRNEPVERRDLTPLRHLGKFLPQAAMGRAGVRRNQIASAQVMLKVRQRERNGCARLHRRLRVTDASGDSQ